jgi:hypothetical protein
MAKSSLKKWLKNKPIKRPQGCIFGAEWLNYVTEEADGSFYDGVMDTGNFWFIDVLDDGTAITYCSNKD